MASSRAAMPHGIGQPVYCPGDTGKGYRVEKDCHDNADYFACLHSPAPVEVGAGEYGSPAVKNT